MSNYSEEEQIEALKSWWKNNGTALLIGIGLAVAIVVGWEAWQKHQAQERMAAAGQFQQLLGALSAPASASEEHQEASVSYIADQLRAEHGDSVYATLGSILEARHEIGRNAPEAAAESLEWALAHVGAAPLPLVIRERLARAYLASGDYDAALETLAAVSDPGAFTAIYRELEGDIHKAQGDIEAARTAYEAANEAMPEGMANPVLQYKMADMAIAGDA